MTSQAIHYSVPRSTQITDPDQQGQACFWVCQFRVTTMFSMIPGTNWYCFPCPGGDQSSEVLIKQLAQGTTEAFCQEVRAPSLCLEEREKQRAISFEAKSTNGPLNTAHDVLMDNRFPPSSKEKFVFRGSRGCGSHLFTPL